jgi:hypothetical protein
MTIAACILLLLAVFAYVFWPEKYSARQPQKTRSNSSASASRSSTTTCATSISNTAPANIPKKTTPPSVPH